jgi:hypothetical protein
MYTGDDVRYKVPGTKAEPGLYKRNRGSTILSESSSRGVLETRKGASPVTEQDQISLIFSSSCGSQSWFNSHELCARQLLISLEAHTTMGEVLPSESLYPSRLEIEAIEIPDCQEVFQRKANVTRRGETCSGHVSSKPTQTTTPSCQDQLSSYSCKAFARNESGGSSTTQPRMDVPGPPHISRFVLEVAPGLFLPLHGSQETSSAMQEGKLVSCNCFVCMETVMCVPQASYVLCPDCRVVSPVAGCLSLKRRVTLPGEMGGVGLGLKWTEYLKWEQESVRYYRQRSLRSLF